MVFVRSVLDGLLQLSVRSFPPFPTDVLLEIMKWSALCHQKPLTLTLLPPQIRECVESTVFSNFVINDTSRYREYLSLTPDDKTFISLLSDASPRIRQCRSYVQNITLNVKIRPHTLSNLSSLFPNTRQLVLYPYHAYPLEGAVTIPSLTLLDCNGSIFHNLGFSNSLSLGLTTLSLHILPWHVLTGWKWDTLLQLTKLSYFWITAPISNDHTQSRLLITFKRSILPNLPSHVHFCAFRLIIFGVPRRNADGSFNVRDCWYGEDVYEFADGSWDLRAVLVLAKEQHPPIPQAVIVPAEVKDIWDVDREEVLAVVRGRTS
ncbi:hypothetical protein DL96DRAFT_1627719 [Flagelloscypha sp. PMI_526]|nr:hypothetical protein DL96DRAFT_1627719 [Flagelloscypha sp. PMI_526]